MTIKKIFEELPGSMNPVAKVLHKGKDFRLLAIGFVKGMKLKDHQAHLPSKLTVLSGTVIYRQGDNEETLTVFDEVVIPVEVTHSVEATDDSLCLLSQGW